MLVTWALIKHQLEYLKLTICLVALAVVCIGIPVTLSVDRLTRVTIVWRTLLTLGGVILCFRYWLLDLKERRILLWWMVPVPARAVATARIVLPFALQLSLLLPALLTLPFWPAAGEGRTVSVVLGELLSVQGLVLAIVMACYVTEEVCVFLSPWRWAIMLINIAVGIPVGVLVLHPEGVFPSFGSWYSVAFWHGAALLMAVFTNWMFLRRRSYLVGINPWHGLPVDWRNPE